MFYLHCAVLLFGCAGLFGKFIALPAMIIVAGRTLFAALTLGAFLFVLKRNARVLPQVSGRAAPAIVLSGMVLAVHWWSFFHSIRIATVAIGLISFSTFPLFVTFLEPFVFREKLRLRDSAAAIAVMAGVLLLIPSFDFGNTVFRGVLWGTFSGFTFALLALMNRNFSRTIRPETLAFVQNGTAFLCFFPFLAVHPPLLTLADTALIIALGVFCTALAHALFIHSLTRVRAHTASVVASLEPVYGIVLALLILHEIPDMRTIAGGAIILCTTLLCTIKHR
ncbi:MAG: DMT family transporter [Chitinispirillaceae bacterium]|nr:DMT family transporter [Chitinispirillaceae bacterium]